MSSRKLDGWKEIASYLGCAIKTAQRLEKLARLPVHRLPSADDGSVHLSPVYAFSEELDRWQANTAAAGIPVPEPLEPGNVESRSSRTPAIIRFPRTRGRSLWLPATLAVIIGVAAYAAVSWYSRRGEESGGIQYARIEAGRLVGYAAGGTVAWKRDLPGAPLPSHDRSLLPYQFADIDGDGAVDVLLPLLLAGKGTPSRLGFFCFDSSGNQSWSFYPDSVPALRLVPGRYRIWEYSTRIHLFRSGLAVTLLLQRQDDSSSCLAILDHRGHLAGTSELGGQAYCHVGADLNHDGFDEIVVAGQNALGAPFLESLRWSAAEWSGQRSAESADPIPCTPTAYCILPRMDVSRALGKPEAASTILNISPDQLSVEVVILDEPHILERSYLVDHSLKPIHLEVHQGLKSLQRKLFMEGKIDHDWSDSEIDPLMRFRFVPPGAIPPLFWSIHE